MAWCATTRHALVLCKTTDLSPTSLFHPFTPYKKALLQGQKKTSVSDITLALCKGLALQVYYKTIKFDVIYTKKQTGLLMEQAN